MSKKFNYQSIYAPYFKQFIAMKQGLGYIYLRSEWIFFELDKFFVKKNLATIGITKEIVEQWRATRINDSPSTILAKYSLLSQFCRYLCNIGYDCYIPRMPAYPVHNSLTPHIFSNREMAEIFRVSDDLSLHIKKMSTILFIMPAIIRLLYGTGLRISEALSLKNKDVDFGKRCVYVRKSKNGEERLAPLSDSLVEVLKTYTYYRNQMPLPSINDDNGFFFISPSGTYCRAGSVYNWFRKVLAESGIPHIGNHKGPRVHDLMHSFSVHSLVKMAKSGLDLYCSLPLLSTFLGHKSIGATEQYVRLTAEMYPELLKDEKGICAYVFPKTNNQTYDGNY